MKLQHLLFKTDIEWISQSWSVLVR